MAKAIVEQGLESNDESVEKRRSARTELVVRIDYTTVDAFFSEFTSDINEGGLFIETDTPAPIGTEVLLKFKLPDTDDPIKVQGRVVWTSLEQPTAVPGMGIEFSGLDEVARRTIDQVVRRLRAEPVRTARRR